MENVNNIACTTSSGLSGQYLVFSIGLEKYAVPISKIQEIMGVFPVTPIPNSPDYLKGVINLRGKIIAVIDLRRKLLMPEREYDERTCFIVVNLPVSGQSLSLAMVVDHVEEVYDFESNQIEMAADFGISYVSQFVLAVGKAIGHGDEAITLLDIEKLVIDSIPKV